MVPRFPNFSGRISHGPIGWKYGLVWRYETLQAIGHTEILWKSYENPMEIPWFCGELSFSQAWWSRVQQMSPNSWRDRSARRTTTRRRRRHGIGRMEVIAMVGSWWYLMITRLLHIFRFFLVSVLRNAMRASKNWSLSSEFSFFLSQKRLWSMQK